MRGSRCPLNLPLKSGLALVLALILPIKGATKETPSFWSKLTLPIPGIPTSTANLPSVLANIFPIPGTSASAVSSISVCNSRETCLSASCMVFG